MGKIFIDGCTSSKNSSWMSGLTMSTPSMSFREVAKGKIFPINTKRGLSGPFNQISEDRV